MPASEQPDQHENAEERQALTELEQPAAANEEIKQMSEEKPDEVPPNNAESPHEQQLAALNQAEEPATNTMQEIAVERQEGVEEVQKPLDDQVEETKVLGNDCKYRTKSLPTQVSLHKTNSFGKRLFQTKPMNLTQ